MEKMFLVLGLIVMISFNSCEKEDDLLPFQTNFVEYHAYDGRITELRVIIQNNTSQTIYYTKFRLELRKDGKNISSDIYEFGSKDNKNSWNVDPKDTTPTPWVSCNIPYYENEGGLYKWHITEIIEYLSY